MPTSDEPGSKLVVLGMAIPPLIGNPRILILGYNGYINPYYWVDDHPLLYGNNGRLDPIAQMMMSSRGVYNHLQYLTRYLGSVIPHSQV